MPTFKNKKIYDYCSQEGQKKLMSEKELPGRMEASIRLSNGFININAIKDSLRRSLPDVECKQKGNDVILVSWYPPSFDFGESKILAIIQGQDPNARMA